MMLGFRATSGRKRDPRLYGKSLPAGRFQGFDEIVDKGIILF
jgi:hypothetical protein